MNHPVQKIARTITTWLDFHNASPGVRKVEKCRDRFRMRCEIRYVEVPRTFKVEKCVNGGRLCFNTSKTVSHEGGWCIVLPKRLHECHNGGGQIHSPSLFNISWH